MIKCGDKAMVLKFEIYDTSGNLIGKTELDNGYTYDHYKNLFSPNGRMDFDFIPEDKNYERGRFDFHGAGRKVEENKELLIIKITVSKYELLKKNTNPKDSFDYSTDWKPFPQ